MAREISNQDILQEIYDWTGATNGTMESLEEMRGAIRSLCLCSEDVERSEDVEGPHPWSDEGEDGQLQDGDYQFQSATGKIV